RDWRPVSAPTKSRNAACPMPIVSASDPAAMGRLQLQPNKPLEYHWKGFDSYIGNLWLLRHIRAPYAHDCVARNPCGDSLCSWKCYYYRVICNSDPVVGSESVDWDGYARIPPIAIACKLPWRVRRRGQCGTV